jgi:centrosomal protein CEP290
LKSTITSSEREKIRLQSKLKAHISKEKSASKESLTGKTEKIVQTEEIEMAPKTSNTKQMDLVYETRKLKRDMKELQEKEKELNIMVSSTAKYFKFNYRVEEENLKLRKQLRKDSEKSRDASHKIQELSVQKEEMIKDIVQLRKLIAGIDKSGGDPNLLATYADNIANLKNEVQQKDKIINELQNPDTDEHSRLLAENRKLLRESQMWQLRATKLSQDLAQKQVNQPHVQQAKWEQTETDSKAYKLLLEEVEDLRYNYKESVRQNLLYEERLQGTSTK